MSDIKFIEKCNDRKSEVLNFSVDRILSNENVRKFDKTFFRKPLISSQLGEYLNNYACDGLRSAYCLNSFYTYNLPDFFNGVRKPFPIRPTPTSIPINNMDQYTYGKEDPVCNERKKRSWTRAVFSSLQRKGLEKRFTIQKYITKPDRRQLAATLGLTDAQVKVWFQNRRMKWRHTKDNNYGSNASEKSPTPTRKMENAVDKNDE